MKKLLFTLLVVTIITITSQAASLYILYDEACMDRLEYVYKNNDEGGEYIVYQINTNPGEKIILEVGTESATPQDFLPAQFIRCNNAVFDEKLVNAINSNIDRVFMVVKKGNSRYFISPITFAARYLRSQDFILYDSPKYRFQFDLKMGTIGENIAYKNPNATVNFEGKLDNVCSGEFIFRQYSEFSGNPHTDLVLVPEVGIIEERSGINAADAIKNTLRLEKVNGRKLDRYLNRLCTGRDDEVIPVEPQEALTAREVPETAPQEYNTFIGGPSQPNVPKLPEVATSGVKTHVVKKGETLYRISKMYGISVDQLRSWNGKGNSNLIRVGEQLKVAGEAGLTPKSIGSVTTPSDYSVLGGRINTNTSPTPSSNLSTSTSPKSAAEWGSTKNHVVRRGETVASIAMKYGYTESKFRDINNMTSNEFIKVGQILRTTDCPETPTTEYQQTAAEQPQSYYQPTNPGLTARSPELVTVQPSQPSYKRNIPRGKEVESFSDDNLNKQVNENQYRNTPYFLNRSTTQPQEETVNSYNAPPQQNEFYTVQPRSGNNAGTPQEFYTVQPRSPQTTATPNSYGVPQTAMPGYTPSTPQQYSTVSPRTTERTVYIVKDGDTLYSIARTYGLTIEKLRSLNNLARGEVLIPYQKIYLN